MRIIPILHILHFVNILSIIRIACIIRLMNILSMICKWRRCFILKQVIAIINQKGGVGKSTTAHALGCGLKKQGFKVLFIDLDAQGNLSYTLGADTNKVTILDLLMQKADIKDTIQKTSEGDCIVSSNELSGADITITQTGKEYRLKEALESISNEYDYVILDTPPALGILTVNALTACTQIVIPSQADIYSLQGIGQLYGTIKTVKQYCNSNLKISGILLTRYNSRAILSRDITELIADTAKQLNTIVFKTPIRECIALKEAQARKKDIYSYAPKSNATIDYESFLKEFLGEIK